MTKIKCDETGCLNNENGYCMTDYIWLELIPYEGFLCHESKYGDGGDDKSK